MEEQGSTKVTSSSAMATGGRRSLIIGAVAGLLIAAVVVVVAWINNGRSQPLEAVMNFFAAVPVLLAWTAGLPQSVSIRIAEPTFLPKRQSD
jgi:hypothetical protein